MITSGNTAISTNGDAAVTVLTLNSSCEELTIVNEGATAGFVSIDNGSSWARLPAGPSARTFRNVTAGSSLVVQVRRIAGGTDLSGIWADAHS